MGTKLLSLPQELLVDILERAGPKSTLICETTCRTLHDVVRTSTRLQYQVELFAACKVDSDFFRARDDLHLTRTQRLRILQNRERAWRELRWRDRLEIRLPSFAHFNTLSSGIFFLHSESSSERTQLAWTALPSIDDPEKSKEVEWQEITLDFGLRGICLDVAQDFQAHIQQVREMSRRRTIFDIHLRTLSTNTPHPDASIDTIRLVLDFFVSENFDHPIITEVAGDHIGLLFVINAGPLDPPFQDTFILYDWKRAIRKDCPWPSSLHRVWNSFTLLSDDFVLLPNLATSCLDLYRHTDDPNSLRLLMSFGLPPLRPNWLLADITHSPDDPLLSTSKLDRSPRQHIYRSNPDESILSFILEYDRQDGPVDPDGPRTYALVTHRATLLSYKPPTVPKTSGQDSKVVAWDDWGPQSTRMLLCPRELHMSCVHGARYAMLSRLQGEHNFLLELFDFNRHRMRTKRDDLHPRFYKCEGTFSRWAMSEYDSTSYNSAPFELPLVTSLPYCQSKCGPLVGWEGFLMDDECVVGIIKGAAVMDILMM